MFYPVLFLLLLSIVGFYLNKNKSVHLSKSQKLSSLPSYYGYLAFLYIFIPAIIIWLGLLIGKSFILQNYLTIILGDALSVMNSDEINLFLSKVKNLSLGISFGNETDLEKFAAEKIISFDKIFSLLTYLVLTLSSVLAFFIARKKVIPNFKSQRIVERIINRFIQICSLIAILITLGIFLSLVFETLNFFSYVNPLHFLFGLNWSPNKAFVIDSADTIDKDILRDAFGIIPLLGGTLLIAFLAMIVAIPLGLMSAIYLAEYAPKKIRDFSKPVIEILAGIPTVVYGFFAALVVAPKIVMLGKSIGFEVEPIKYSKDFKKEEIKKYGLILESKKPYENQLSSWINNNLNEKGYKIDFKAAQMLVEHLGCDLKMIARKSTKLNPASSQLEKAKNKIKYKVHTNLYSLVKIMMDDELKKH